MPDTTSRRALPLTTDQAGQTTVEYALLLAVFGLPMFVVFAWLLEITAGYYGMVSFLETLPLP